jgi:FdhD protein
MDTTDQPVIYCQFQAGQWSDHPAQVVQEAAVNLSVNGEAWLMLMCSPNRLEWLAVGLLFNEGVINGPDELASLRVCPDGTNIDVWLTHSAARPESWRRTSGCTGGKTAAGQSAYRLAPLPQPLSPETLLDLMSQLYQSQGLYQQTGGIHVAALSDGQNLRAQAEDIGRHNTLDKLAGQILLERLDFFPRILLTTGRISSEMLQKAARMGVTLLASRSSPTSLSISLAAAWGLTQVGYTRRDRFIVYAHPENLREAAP